MGYLYINSKGQPHRRHSYSAGMTFEQNSFKYYMQKVLGWRERDLRASFMFGHDLESAVQYHHENNGGGAVEKFVQLWNLHKDTPNIKYTDAEQNWENCLRMGVDMIKLYVVRQPDLLPLGNRTVFQREYEKPVFSDEDPVYGGITHYGKLDIVAFLDPSCPYLQPVDWREEYGLYRPIICDIKTSAVDFAEQNLAGYDLQLRSYSWLSGIRDVSLLFFVKKGIGLKKGYSVSLLESTDTFNAGAEAVIAKMGDDDKVWLVSNDFMILEMERIQGKKEDGKTEQTNVAKQRAMNWLEQYGVLVDSNKITKQRIQFNTGFVSEQSAHEAGLIVSRQIHNIVNASLRNEWPNTAGVRYPKDDRNDPFFRAFVLKDTIYRDQNFIKSDELQFDQLFEDDDNG